MIPSDPRKLPSIRRNSWRRHEVSIGDERSNFAAIESDSDNLIGGFAVATVVLTNTEEKSVIRGQADIGPGKTALRGEGLGVFPGVGH